MPELFELSSRKNIGTHITFKVAPISGFVT